MLCFLDSKDNYLPSWSKAWIWGRAVY